MPDGYALEIDGDVFEPVPRRWVDHEHAVDHDADAPTDAVRLYAVSYAISENEQAVRVRYAYPRGHNGVLQLQTGACPDPEREGYLPCGLVPPVRSPWPRTYVPAEWQEPDDVARQLEREHLLALWADRLESDGAAGVTIADGGRQSP